MPKSDEPETLSQYVARVMREKDLSALDVEARSGNDISDIYVTNIERGIASNPSISKLQGLAKGLGVDEDELFRVARGLPIKHARKQGGDPWPSNVLVKAIERIISNPDLTRLVQAALTMKPSKVKAVLAFIESEKE